jgi:Thiopeptide-type bacteriocin precursor
MKDALSFDLAGIELGDLEVLAQDGARGIPEFAASSGNCTFSCPFCGGSSGSIEEPSNVG